jgi:hypothetical protein
MSDQNPNAIQKPIVNRTVGLCEAGLNLKFMNNDDDNTHLIT